MCGGAAAIGANAKVSPLLWVVILCTALSCFFALTGYSLRGYRRAQLDEKINGSTRRQRLDRLEPHLPALRLTASFCRGATNIVLAVCTVYLYDAVPGDWPRTLAAIGTVAGLVAVFGVAIPHAWSNYAGERIFLAVAPAMLALRYALYPIVWFMQAFDVPIRRLSGFRDEEDENGEAAKEEILQAAEDGRAEGAVDADELEMIESVMEFGDTRAGQIMTPRTDIFALPADTEWRDACRRIMEAGHTRVPVYTGDIDNIVGVLYAKDLLGQVAQEQPGQLKALMRKPFFVPETKPLDDLLREFKARKVHMAVVLDEYGGTAGLVTIEDLLEEIVGEISDEYDRPEEALLHRVDEITIEVDGRLYVDELNDALELDLPEDEDYDTVAGMVFSELGYVPSVGEELTTHGAKFTVLEADDRKITRLRVQLAAAEDAGRAD